MIPMLRVRSNGYSRIKGAPPLPSTDLRGGFWRTSGSLAIAFTTNPFVTPKHFPVLLNKTAGKDIPAGRSRCIAQATLAKPPARFCPRPPPAAFASKFGPLPAYLTDSPSQSDPPLGDPFSYHR